MKLESKYDFGDIVYLKTDPDQVERIVTGITYRPLGVLYSISYTTTESSHYDFEITRERDILKTTTN